MKLREICVSHQHQGMCTQATEDQQLCIPAWLQLESHGRTLSWGRRHCLGACSSFKWMRQFHPNLQTRAKRFRSPSPFCLCYHWVEQPSTGAGGNGRSREADGSGSGQQPGRWALCLTLPIFCCFCRTLYITHALWSTSRILATQNSHPF